MKFPCWYEGVTTETNTRTDYAPEMGSETVARSVSIIAHPFVMIGAMVAAAALRFETPREAARTVAVVAVLTVLPVAALMVRQIRRGSWANADASNRAERPILFTVGIVALLALLVYALVLRPGSFLVRGAITVMIMLAVCAVATRWIKVSLHMAFGALAAETLLFAGSPAGWIVVAILPVLAWSRFALGRHKPAEIAIGLLVGCVTGWALR